MIIFLLILSSQTEVSPGRSLKNRPLTCSWLSAPIRWGNWLRPALKDQCQYSIGPGTGWIFPRGSGTVHFSNNNYKCTFVMEEMKMTCFHFSSDLGSALSGSNCGFQWSDVQRLRGADTIPGTYLAPHCAPIPHGGAPVFGPLSWSAHYHCRAGITG